MDAFFAAVSVRDLALGLQQVGYSFTAAQLVEHKAKAIQAIYSIVDELKCNNILVQRLYHKHENNLVIAVLMLVDEDVFLSDDFNNAYCIARKATDMLNGIVFKVDFSFVSWAPETDESVIFADGYIAA